jgi:hypothetical protein
MRRLLTTPFRSLLAALGLFVVAASGHAQQPPGTLPFDPSHYWTYTFIDQIPLPQTVFAKDQFFRNGVPLTVEKRERLLNWVFKNGSAVRDTLIHYTWWNVLEKLPVNRRVIVSNQFGSFPVQVLNLEFMLVPAYKNFANPTGGPTGPLANHYLCYRATGFPGPPVAYDLLDEWRRDLQQPQAMEFLCAPCAKEHQGQIFPVVDTVTHLAAYPIVPVSTVFSPFVLDQFLAGGGQVIQHPVEYLFVPGEKTDNPVDVKRNTWGNLKKLYK